MGLSLLALLFGLAACSTTTGTETPPSENSDESNDVEQANIDQIFTFAGHNDMVSLDVSLINDEMSALIMYAINEGLVRNSYDEVVSGLADSYDISEDGLIYTFNLRDATWSDGVEVTADDFVYSFFRTLDPDTGSSQTSSFDSIVNAAAYASGELTEQSEVGIEALDDKTLQLTLAVNNPFFIDQLAQGTNFYPIRQDLVEEHGESYGSNPETFIGTGPFVLTSWEKESTIELEKNEVYWDAERITLDKVIELIIPDENTRVSMFELGDVDALYSISASQTVSFSDYGTYAGGTLQYLALNSDEGELLNNESLRKALSYAIDRESIVNAIASPGTEVAERMVDPSILIEGDPFTTLFPNSTNVPSGGDEEQALAYLEEALDQLGLSDPAELPDITYVSMDSPVHQQYAEALQENWRDKLNINVNLSILPVPQAIGALIEGDFDITLVSQSTGVNPDTLLKGFTVGNGNNYSNWENDAYSELITEQASNQDFNASMEQLQEAESILLESAATVPLWLPGSAYLVQDYVGDLHYGRQTGSIEFIYASILE